MRRVVKPRGGVPGAVVALGALIWLLPPGARADSACWREPLLLGQKVVGLVPAYALWRSGTETSGADALPPAQDIPSFDARGRPLKHLHCRDIVSRVNDTPTPCPQARGKAGQPVGDIGNFWVPVIEGPRQGRVRVPVHGGGSVWLRVDAQQLAADAAKPWMGESLARHGQAGQLQVWQKPADGDAPLKAAPRLAASSLGWDGEPERQALAFVQAVQAASGVLGAGPLTSSPPVGWLHAQALREQGRWQLLTQVTGEQSGPEGLWWRVQQWLAPAEPMDAATAIDGRRVLDDGSGGVRSTVLRDGWVRHRDPQGRVLAVVTDGENCD